MIRVLFVCVENSCRSQMAEAFAKIHGRDRVDAYSAGSRPSGVVNPKAVSSMKEVGYDLSIHTSKSIESIPQGEFDYLISMGCGDACPNVPAKCREDWDIPDPKKMTATEFAKIRDRIEMKVENLVATAGK